jgi:hypothetical protein
MFSEMLKGRFELNIPFDAPMNQKVQFLAQEPEAYYIHKSRHFIPR